MNAKNDGANKGRMFLVGSGAHARKLYHYVRASGAGFGGFLSEVENDKAPVGDQPLRPLSQLADPLPGDTVMVAIGHPGTRRRLSAFCEDKGWKLGTLVHRTAYCAPDARIGEGTVVCAGAVVETGARVGRGVIIDVGAIVDHDVIVSDFAHIRAGQICTSASTHTQ